MFNTDCAFLHAELMDVVRALGVEDEEIFHAFSYGNSRFTNTVSFRGENRVFVDEYVYTDELEYKRYAKRYAKLALYNAVTLKLGVKLPWGALTGIRPTKLAYSDKNFKELFKLMGVSGENCNLVERVLKAQKGIYGKGGQDVFISIPFCPTKCEYCSFITAPINSTQKYLDGYLDCLISEIKSIKYLVNDLRSVYIGGGTPFVLSEKQLERVYSAVAQTFPTVPEFTVEAGRADVFSREKLKLSKDYKVTRICVNPQSFNDKTLAAIGRKHTAAQTEEAYYAAKEYGFDINIDLIAGLADESIEEFGYSLNRAVQLNPANITVHTLSLKAGAKLKEEVKRLNVSGIDKMVALSREALTASGYEPYYLYRQKYQAGGCENVGWTKYGKACVYNIDVMEECADNIAVGANAISKRLFSGGARIERLASPKDIVTYISKYKKIMEERAQLFK